MVKKNLLRGIVILGVLTASAGLSASYVDDAAELIINEELTEKDLVKDFDSEEIAKIREKVKELKLKDLREQRKKEAGKKNAIIVNDLERKVNNRFSKLESRVSSL